MAARPSDNYVNTCIADQLTYVREVWCAEIAYQPACADNVRLKRLRQRRTAPRPCRSSSVRTSASTAARSASISAAPSDETRPDRRELQGMPAGSDRLEDVGQHERRRRWRNRRGRLQCRGIRSRRKALSGKRAGMDLHRPPNLDHRIGTTRLSHIHAQHRLPGSGRLLRQGDRLAPEGSGQSMTPDGTGIRSCAPDAALAAISVSRRALRSARPAAAARRCSSLTSPAGLPSASHRRDPARRTSIR